MKRRNLLLFLGAVAGTATVGTLVQTKGKLPGGTPLPKLANPLSFKPIAGPLPTPTDPLPANQHLSALKSYTIVDDLTLPEDFTYDILAAWGDPIGTTHVGYNNDYLAFVETAPNAGYLSINFEYISPIPWMQSYEQVIGKALPFQAVQAQVAKVGKTGLNAFGLADQDPLKGQIREICQAALNDQGLGIIFIRKNAEGRWERVASPAERRISGIAGLTDQRYLGCTGPAKAIFQKTQGQGYIDKLGDRIIGTFANCAGGLTPWGTVLSAEENIQTQVPEAVYADGTAFPPQSLGFNITPEELSGQGNVLGLAGNKYGWIVEIDPANPQDNGTKHTWLGRYRHEAVGVRVSAGQPLAFYSGCDRRGGHLYKFVSQAVVQDPQQKSNSKLLEQGMLYAAKFNPDGSGEWIALKPETPVNPELPSNLVGGMITLPQRPEGGYSAVRSPDKVQQFKQRFKTLGDLYSGSPAEQQGAILIDAHYAANACGATCTARPEDTEVAPDGSLYVTFTSGTPSVEDGGPDRRIFKGPQGETPYEYGFILHLTEQDNQPQAMRFSWKMLALGGEPSQGGAGFSNPDNLMIDPQGNVWVVTDMSSDKMNKPGKQPQDLRGNFGNNSMWLIPTQGEQAGQAFRFAIGPMESELTGPFLTSDQTTLFLSVQHPGETHGMCKHKEVKLRELKLKTLDGQEFTQERVVPVGSNFPSKQLNQPPKPVVVAIRRSQPHRTIT